MTRAEQIKAAHAKRQDEIVEVFPPSGETYLFRKPSKFRLLFHMGSLPQSAASDAVGKWTEAGIMKAAEEGDPEVLKLAQTMFDLRDFILDLSHSPKLVVGVADASKDELSTDDVPDDDLAYFLAWAQAGGDASKLLARFSGGPGSGAVAGNNRKERRTAAKRTRRS